MRNGGSDTPMDKEKSNKTSVALIGPSLSKRMKMIRDFDQVYEQIFKSDREKEEAELKEMA